MLSLILTLAIIGVLLWVLDRYVPMDAGIKTVIRVVVLIAVVVYVLQAFGLVNMGIPQLR